MTWRIGNETERLSRYEVSACRTTRLVDSKKAASIKACCVAYETLAVKADFDSLITFLQSGSLIEVTDER